MKCYVEAMEAWARPKGNLCGAGQTARLRQGVVVFAIGLVAATVMATYHVHPAFKLLLFLPFSMAGLAVFQGSYRVCPGAARLGKREQNGQLVRICNPKELAEVRSIGRRVMRHGLTLGACATALVMLLT